MNRGIFKEIWPVVEAAAPTVARIFGGAPAFAVSYILPIIAEAFKADPKNIPELVKTMMDDPEAKEKLACIEEDHHDWLCGILDSINHLDSVECSFKLKWK
jgi:hypothetical protein